MNFKQFALLVFTFIAMSSCGGRYYYFEPGNSLTMVLHQGETKSVTLQIGRMNCDEAINFHLENDLKPDNLSFTFQPNPVVGNSVTLSVAATNQAALGKFLVVLEGTNACNDGRRREFFGLEILAP